MDAGAPHDTGATMNNCTPPALSPVPAMTRTGPALWTRLPAGRWQVRFWEDADGQTLLDVASPDGTLASRLVGALCAPPSIEACWAGCGASGLGPHAEDPQAEDQCWALAIGRIPAGRGHVVSFAPWAIGAGRRRITMPFESSSGLWITHRGLWVAAVMGCYTHVRLTAQPEILLRPLISVMG
jgi:hypothetical protein